MPAFLSDEWIEALDAVARADDGLRTASADLAVAVRHEITGAPGDGSPATFHVALDHGTVSADRGPVPPGSELATIVFRQDRETAVAIAVGDLSAQRAFMSGRLRVDGDLSVLVERRDLLAGIGDVFAALRADTDWPGADEENHRA